MHLEGKAVMLIASRISPNGLRVQAFILGNLLDGPWIIRGMMTLKGILGLQSLSLAPWPSPREWFCFSTCFLQDVLSHLIPKAMGPTDHRLGLPE